RAAVRERVDGQGGRRRPRRASRRRDLSRDASRAAARTRRPWNVLALHAEPPSRDRAPEGARSDPRAEPDPHRPARRGNAGAAAPRGRLRGGGARMAAELLPRVARRRARRGPAVRAPALPAVSARALARLATPATNARWSPSRDFPRPITPIR